MASFVRREAENIQRQRERIKNELKDFKTVMRTIKQTKTPTIPRKKPGVEAIAAGDTTEGMAQAVRKLKNYQSSLDADK